MIRFDVLTLFPEIIHGYRSQSILRLASERGLLEIVTHDIRDWTHDRHRSVDDRPFGGGPGMVLRPEPVVECVEAVQQMGERPGRLVLLTPQGRRFDQRRAEALADEPRLLLLCGRYEGIDQRVVDLLRPEEISVGDFILGGGEVGAMVIMDATVRLVPGVLGDERSNQQDSFSGDAPLLEYPQYTRPRVYRGLEVPPVLLGGNHAEIDSWRQTESLRCTRERRSDLLRPRRDDQNQTNE